MTDQPQKIKKKFNADIRRRLEVFAKECSDAYFKALSNEPPRPRDPDIILHHYFPPPRRERKVAYYPRTPSELMDLHGQDLSKLSLAHIDLRGANLCGADLSQSILREASFAGADLIDAKLFLANCVMTDFKEADLTRADLRSGNFESAIFTRATIIDIRTNEWSIFGRHHWEGVTRG